MNAMSHRFEADDPRLTAFALADPSLSDDDRAAVAAALTTQPELAALVAEIQWLGELVQQGLQAEQAQVIPSGLMSPALTVPAAEKAPVAGVPVWPRNGRVLLWAGGLAAAVAIGLGLFALQPDAPWQDRGTEVVSAPNPMVPVADPPELLAPTRTAASETTLAESKPMTSMNLDGKPTSRSARGATAEPLARAEVTQDGEAREADRPKLGLAPLLPTDAVNPTPPSLPVPSPLAGPANGPAPASAGMPAPGLGGLPSGPPGGIGGFGGIQGGISGGIGGGGIGGGRPESFHRKPGALAGSLPGKPAAGELSADEKRFAKGSPEPESLHPMPKKEAEEAPGGRFQDRIENPFVPVQGAAALSTFGVDVDTASYGIVRRYLTSGSVPPAAAVRLEELVNYFPYRDAPPEGDQPYAVRVELAQCPWQPRHQLARIAVKAKPIEKDRRPPSNLVFLIDVSGSMQAPNRLPLVKQSLKLLLNQLGENDRVAMVVYAGSSGLVLDSTSAVNKSAIIEALDRLEAGGSTNGAGGLEQAYAVAVANFQKNGTNRVILCTDGDFNVGPSSTESLVKLIEEKRKTGVFLSIFGFGMGNLRDEMMVQLANKGNGNYGYIDSLKEAHKALVEQASGTLVTVAKDVKIQVEFNPAVVGSYRLLGYEKRLLATQDFHDDRKDAGEMGAGHVVTVFYELIPAGAAKPPQEEELRYQPAAKPAIPAGNPPAGAAQKPNEAFVVKMRHKKPDAQESTYRELPVPNQVVPFAQASEDFRFGAAVAGFALRLQHSAYQGELTFAQLLDMAANAMTYDPSGYRAEFLELIRLAQRHAGQP